jgi:hypothetical protein
MEPIGLEPMTLSLLDEITMTTNSFVYQNAESGDAKV